MVVSPSSRSQYPRLVAFVEFDFPLVRWLKPDVWASFLKFAQLSPAAAYKAVSNGGEPTLAVEAMPGSNGKYRGSIAPNVVYLAKSLCERFEQDYYDPRARLLVESTILHELVHWGDWKDGKDQPGEEGKLFEIAAYGRDINRYW